MSKKAFSEYYKQDNVTGTYDKQREGTEFRRSQRAKELGIFLDLLNKKPREKVLELGCSSGFLTKELGAVTAIDTSKDMLIITKKKNPKATVICSDMFDLPKPFKPKSFDKIVVIRVLTHLDEEELSDVLKKINLTLKIGGYLVFDLEEQSIMRQIARLIYTNFFNLFRSKENEITGYDVYQYSVEEASDLLKKAGFEVQGIEYLNHKVGRQFMILAKKTNDKGTSKRSSKV